uniref:Putative ovule protein n=1 Tax=Solanum chacoense TaxID=4108 RepID=A0A0V0GM64_SOLCH
MASLEIPLLQMFANALMCFMPYCVSEPQCASKRRTVDFRHSQSSTRGRPGFRTELRTEHPLLDRKETLQLHLCSHQDVAYAAVSQ